MKAFEANKGVNGAGLSIAANSSIIAVDKSDDISFSMAATTGTPWGWKTSLLF